MSTPSTSAEQSDQQDPSVLEKTAAVSQTHNDKEDYAEGHGDFQVTLIPGAKDVKLAKDGKTVLIPQPSDDPDDVLNWKPGKKFRVLLSLVFASLVMDLVSCELDHQLIDVW